MVSNGYVYKLGQRLVAGTGWKLPQADRPRRPLSVSGRAA